MTRAMSTMSPTPPAAMPMIAPRLRGTVRTKWPERERERG